MHAIKTNVLTVGTRAIAPIATAVIGLVCTAPNAQAEVKSALATGVVASNNALTFTSKLIGTAGNAISIALINPNANNAVLSVAVAGNAITVNLATGSTSTITTTAAQLTAAIAAYAAANALVGVANTGASTGASAVAALSATLTGGIDEAFPLDTPVLVTDARKAASLAGAVGTLKPSLDAIADQASPVIIVVRVAADATPTNQNPLVIGGVTGGSYTGMQALLAAEAVTGVRPRILACPGLDTQAVTTALVIVAKKLRAMAYAAAVGADIAAASTYAGNFGDRELMLIWPNFSGTFAGDAVARAAGLRAQIDEEQGWNKTLSNVPVAGVTGVSKFVYFDIQDTSTDAGLLNDAKITTLIRANGFRFWGNRTTSAEPLFSFESAVRTSQVLQDTIAAGLIWAIDKPLTKGLITDILETVNAEFRSLISQGLLIGAKAWFDPALNSATDLAAGKLTIDYDFTPTAPMEGLTLNQRITGKYYEDFAQQLAA